MKRTKLILILALLLTSLCAGASVKIGDLYYDLDSSTKTASVAEGNSDIIGYAIIPETFTYNSVTYTVTAIGDKAFENAKSLSSYNIPSTVTSIGDYAFYGTSLGYITIGSSIVSIGESAFAGSSISTIEIYTSSLKSIGNYAFQDCENLKKVYVHDLSKWCKIDFSEGSNPLENLNAELYIGYESEPTSEIVIPSDIKEIKDYTFIGAKSVKSITIPEGVTSIGNYAFRECSSLTSITIPEGVTSIGAAAFAYCTNLSSLSIPSSVESIGFYAFTNSAISEVNFYGSSLKNIKEGAFYECNNLKKVNVENLSNWCKIDFSIESGDFSKNGNPLSNPDANFYVINNTQKDEITIPSDITEIKDYTFCGAKNLTSITIPKGVTSLGNYAFADCISLKNLIIPEGVKYIGYLCFSNDSFSLLDIPSTFVSSMFYDFFDGCEINELVYRSSESLGLINSKISVMYLPDNLYDQYSNPLYAYLVDGIDIKRVSYYGAKSLKVGNLTYLLSSTNNEATLISATDNNLGDVVIPSTITNDNKTFTVNSIDDNVFSGCTSLTSVVIPSGIKKIGSNTFKGCTSLTTVKIPVTVSSIEYYAFANCPSLKSLIVPEGVTTIYNNAFQDSKLELLQIPSTVHLEGSEDSNTLDKISVDKLIYTNYNVVDFNGATRIDYLYVMDEVYDQFEQQSTKGYTNLRRISELDGYELGMAQISVVNGKIHFECNKEYNDVVYEFEDYYCSFGSSQNHTTEDIKFPSLKITFTVTGRASKDGTLVAIATNRLTFDTSSSNGNDINGDGEVNIADVTALVNMIMGKNQ